MMFIYNITEVFVHVFIYVDITVSLSLTRAENDAAAYTLC